MRNKFLKFVPAVIVSIAIALLFIPKTLSYLSVEKFFADTDAYYEAGEKNVFNVAASRRRDYYFPGVHIGKLWKKMGIATGFNVKGAHAEVNRDEYLFACHYSAVGACILPYPVVKDYEFGDYRVLRVSSQSMRFPDYQYLVFKAEPGAWRYSGHIDVFDNKKEEPVFKFLDNGLVSVSALAGAGDGYSTKFTQFYMMDGKGVRLLMAMPFEATRQGLGLLDFDISGSFDYVKGVLVGNFKISFLAEQKQNAAYPRALPLLTIFRQLTFVWDGKDLLYDPMHSDISVMEMAQIVSGSYARVYAIFQADFDKLQKADGIKKEWFLQFMDVVKDEGFTGASSLEVHQP
ncbi:MAG: hypothetical protein V2A70_07120 [Candidatus Omnitrophota bacterium]